MPPPLVAGQSTIGQQYNILYPQRKRRKRGVSWRSNKTPSLPFKQPLGRPTQTKPAKSSRTAVTLVVADMTIGQRFSGSSILMNPTQFYTHSRSPFGLSVMWLEIPNDRPLSGTSCWYRLVVLEVK
ncbi:MAG: hypothetical protein IPO07_20535 [Haliscomenobacter sp.]|nr:hypothetical protein [Haliscomenobacter sp.]MBK9490902.1 hypothetical protein [Haliscomenobacter sp.]